MSYEYRVRILVEERRTSDRMRPSGVPWRSRFVKLWDTRSAPSSSWDESEELYARLAADLIDMEERRRR